MEGNDEYVKSKTQHYKRQKGKEKEAVPLHKMTNMTSYMTKFHMTTKEEKSVIND